jgi:SAM-dependent methyltransferase
MGLVARRLENQTLPLFGGPVFFQILRTAYRLGLFDLLSQKPGLTRPEIQQQLQLQEEPAHILLLGCTALKFLRKRGDRYFFRSRLAQRALSNHGPLSIEPILEWMHHIVDPGMRFLEESLREARPAGLQAFPGEGDNLYARIADNPQLQSCFYGAMNMRTARQNEIFLDVVDFNKLHNVLDVAGGDGQILEAIANRYPHIRGTVLEIPSVAELATQRFAKGGLSQRLNAVAGDMLREEFPTGYDAVLFCHVNGNHSPDANRDLMRRAFRALNSGGIVCIYSAFMDDDGTGPLSSAILSAVFYCIVSGKGRQYSRAESTAWLTETGFVDVAHGTLMHNHAVILARKP